MSLHLVKFAERICFLGFGYDKTNIQRLFRGFDVDHLLTTKFCGTALRFTEAEIKGIIHTHFTNTFDARDCRNLELLRQTGVLL